MSPRSTCVDGGLERLDVRVLVQRARCCRRSSLADAPGARIGPTSERATGSAMSAGSLPASSGARRLSTNAWRCSGVNASKPSCVSHQRQDRDPFAGAAAPCASRCARPSTGRAGAPGDAEVVEHAQHVGDEVVEGERPVVVVAVAVAARVPGDAREVLGERRQAGRASCVRLPPMPCMKSTSSPLPSPARSKASGAGFAARRCDAPMFTAPGRPVGCSDPGEVGGAPSSATRPFSIDVGSARHAERALHVLLGEQQGQAILERGVRDQLEHLQRHRPAPGRASARRAASARGAPSGRGRSPASAARRPTACAAAWPRRSSSLGKSA